MPRQSIQDVRAHKRSVCNIDARNHPVFAPSQIPARHIRVLVAIVSARRTPMKQLVFWPIKAVFALMREPSKQFRTLCRACRPARLVAFWRTVVAILLSFSITVPVPANQAESYYKQGQKAEQQNNYDAAYQDFTQALTLEPKNTKYATAVTRMRFYASVQHVRSGVALRESGKLSEAQAEFAKAAQIDPTNLIAPME